MSFFKDKSKRLAHTPKFQNNDRVLPTHKLAYFSNTEVPRKRVTETFHQGSTKRKHAEEKETEAPGKGKPVASGFVSIGNIASNSQFRKLVKNGVNPMSTGTPSEMTMILRQRDGSFTYDEHVLMDLYLNRQFFIRGFLPYPLFQNRIKEAKWKNKDTSGRNSDDVEATKRSTLKQLKSKSKGYSDSSDDEPEEDEEQEASSHSYWPTLLQSVENVERIAPVHYFRNAPLVHVWDSVALPNLSIEVKNPFVDDTDSDAAEDTCNTFWIGRIVHYAGYLALVELANFDGSPDAQSFLKWINFCSGEPMPLGWCQKEGIQLNSGDVVPAAIKASQKLSTRLVNFYERGRCHTIEPKNTELIYKEFSDWQSRGQLYPASAISTEVYKDSHNHEIEIESGMKLEVRHPLLPHKIVGAVISQVLNRNCFIVKTNEMDPKTRVLFRRQLTSPFIFPWGWGSQFGVQVDCATENESSYDSAVLRLDLLPTRKRHEFVPGLKLEAFDVLNPKVCYPATVEKVAGHLLLLHVDHDESAVFVEEEKYMWVDVEFSEIYPVGYFEALSSVPSWPRK